MLLKFPAVSTYIYLYILVFTYSCLYKSSTFQAVSTLSICTRQREKTLKQTLQICHCSFIRFPLFSCRSSSKRCKPLRFISIIDFEILHQASFLNMEASLLTTSSTSTGPILRKTSGMRGKRRGERDLGLH